MICGLITSSRDEAKRGKRKGTLPDAPLADHLKFIALGVVFVPTTFATLEFREPFYAASLEADVEALMLPTAISVPVPVTDSPLTKK